MGYDRNHAIIVSASYASELLDAAHTEAQRMFQGIAPVTPIYGSPVNHLLTFAVLPDGSKEWWDHSNAGDEARTELLRWLNAHRYDDGSSPFEWVEVQYGDDNRKTVVTRHSDEPQYDIIA